MNFDLQTASQVAGVDPSMYDNLGQMQEDLMARAKGDEEFRRQMITARAQAQAQAARQQREMMFGAPTALPSQQWNDRQAAILQRLQAMRGGR